MSHRALHLANHGPSGVQSIAPKWHEKPILGIDLIIACTQSLRLLLSVLLLSAIERLVKQLDQIVPAMTVFLQNGLLGAVLTASKAAGQRKQRIKSEVTQLGLCLVCVSNLI